MFYNFSRRLAVAVNRIFNSATIKVEGNGLIFNTTSRVLFFLTAVLAVVFLFLAMAVFVKPAGAIVNTTVTDASGGSLRLKQSSNFAAVLQVQFGSNENGENLNAIAISFTGTGGS